MAFLKDAFSSLFGEGKRGPSVLGVDIGSSSIKIVQLRAKRGVAILETYGEIALGPYAGFEVGRATNLPAEKLGEALTDVLREGNATTAASGVSIPFASSLVTLIKMPAVPGRQLANMIPLEARKYIPVPIGEVSLDWFVVPGEAQEETAAGPQKIDVLLVAIHNETVQKYRDVLKAAGLNTSFLEIEVFSAVRAALDHGIAPVGVVDLGAATTKVYVVEHGIVRESHIINRGGQDITLAISKSLGISPAEAEKRKREFGLTHKEAAENAALSGDWAEISLLTLEHIFGEVHRILLSYQERRSRVISKVVLVGGGAALKGIVAFAQKKIELPVELAHPFAKVEAPAFLESVLREAGPEFAVSLGVALRKLEEGS